MQPVSGLDTERWTAVSLLTRLSEKRCAKTSMSPSSATSGQMTALSSTNRFSKDAASLRTRFGRVELKSCLEEQLMESTRAHLQKIVSSPVTYLCLNSSRR